MNQSLYHSMKNVIHNMFHYSFQPKEIAQKREDLLWMVALRYFLIFRDGGYKTDERTYAVMFEAYASRGDLDAIKQVTL